MNKKRLAKFGLLAAFLSSLSAAAKTEEQVEVLSISPSGAFRIESRFPNQSADDATADIWVISTKDPDQRVRLPKQSADSPTDDEFHFSPNEEWLFATRHIGSGLRYGNIYHLLRPLRIEAVGEPGSFNDLVWATSVRLGALRTNYGALGFYAMTAFMNWSLDSSRLLIRLCGGEEKRNMLCGFIYFNTRTSKFEVTDYSRRLGKGKAELLACAEPVDPLPGEEELKKRFDALDEQLNKKYAELLAKTDKERVAGVRAAQRDWLKQRDAGEKFYVASFPAAEKSRRPFSSSATSPLLESTRRPSDGNSRGQPRSYFLRSSMAAFATSATS